MEDKVFCSVAWNHYRLCCRLFVAHLCLTTWPPDLTHLCLTSHSLIPLTRRRKTPVGIRVKLTTCSQQYISVLGKTVEMKVITFDDFDNITQTWPPSSKSLPSSLSSNPTTHWPPTSATRRCVCLIFTIRWHVDDYQWCDAQREVHSWQLKSQLQWQQRCLARSWCQVWSISC